MKRMTIKDLQVTEGQLFEGILPGEKLYMGGLSFTEPGEISHADENPEGTHIHDDCELFLIVQGRAVVQVNGVTESIKTGDMILVEPGEDHHIISDEKDPAVVLWCHAG